MSDAPKVDEISGVETTGHEWDGIEELNNPIPKWWVWTAIACCVWSFAYWVVMPSFPIPTSEGWSYVRGAIGYSQREIVLNQIAEIEADREIYREEIAAMPIEKIRGSEELLQIALASGSANFGDNCAPCHGSGGQGVSGFPSLVDDDWIWGGTLDDIVLTIQHGINWEADDETRYGEMPAFVDDELIPEDQARDVTQFVLSLSGLSEDQTAATRGAVVFEEQCSVCHMEDGTGMRELGSPNLADAIWLYGDDATTVYETIAHGRAGTMPAWQNRLSSGAIKELAIYVHSMGGGE